MKKHLLFTFLLLLAGFFVGYYWAVIQEQHRIDREGKRMAQFQVRTEEYEPSCMDLQNENKPTLVTKGSDHFIVIVKRYDFIVLGLNTDADKSPITFWWSADLQNALRQSCGQKFQTDLIPK